jgi:ectoine hydroxylase-related dioxygenase (phytanoyl-CoA dioxygenase family)
MVGQEDIKQFQRDGYAVARGLFSAEEVTRYREHYMAMNESRQDELDKRLNENEPLARFPRIMQPHRFDELSLNWLTDNRLDTWLSGLLGASPYAVQTMVYFKPAGSRGQALHQDQFFLRVQPGTCVAAWMALDHCDEENGCLQVIPGTHDLPVLCSKDADTTVSFTKDTVEVPEGMEPVPVVMEPGDVLFFNGQVIHGSGPNVSQDRFRRALIGHYAVADAEKIAQWYHPVLRMDGSEVDLGVSETGGPCGIWVDENGTPVAKVEGVETRQQSTRHVTQ